MKVLFLSTYDIEGGAARAAHRVYNGLKKLNVENRMLVMRKTSQDRTIFESHYLKDKLGKTWLSSNLESLPTKFYPKRRNVKFSSGVVPEKIAKHPFVKDTDLIHMHWISSGFLNVKNIGLFCQPIVWTLHDMWSFTGGCHYDMGCEGYIKSCGKCPILGSSKTYDLSRWNWIRKYNSWSGLNLTLVSPSNWLASCAKKSSLFKNVPIEVIPNGLDAKIYRPLDKFEARKSLSLPQDKILVLFGSQNISEKRKGITLLFQALSILKKEDISKTINFIIFGAKKTDKFLTTGVETHYLGQLDSDYSLAQAYSAADVFVCPSIQDNLPNTVMESLACGTPCVAFNIGGMPDLIEHKKTGYLAEPFQIEDLARGILWVVKDELRWKKLSDNSRTKFERKFNLLHVVNRYMDLYNRLVA